MHKTSLNPLKSMLLTEFLKERNIKKAAFSKIIGVSQPLTGYYCSGKRTPAPKIMQKIFEATGGKVTPNDFYNLKKGGAQ